MKQSERKIEILNSHCNYIRKLQDTYTGESDDSFSYLVKDIEALSLKIKENNDLKKMKNGIQKPDGNVKLLKFDQTNQSIQCRNHMFSMFSE